MKIFQYDRDIYKNIRHIFDKTEECKIALSSEDKTIPEFFKKRFLANNWDSRIDLYYLFTQITKTSVENLINNIDIINGGVIFDLSKDYPSQYINVIIQYCIENKLTVYILKSPQEIKQDNDFIHYIGGFDEI